MYMAMRALFEEEALPQLDALHNFALRLCKNEQFSKDLVQETLLKAFTYFHTYRQGTNCRAWLFQICKNSYLNDAKRKRLQPVAVDFQEEDSNEYTGRTEEEVRNAHLHEKDHRAEVMPTDMLGDEVATAFEVLPPDYQTVLILCDMEGYTYEEIAEFIQAPVGTIRSRIHRGRKILADRLGSYALTQRVISQLPSARN
jgi:RNA polymerase sigma-70 factor (ECF subfamily)